MSSTRDIVDQLFKSIKHDDDELEEPDSKGDSQNTAEASNSASSVKVNTLRFKSLYVL